jgi:hypothetical protein
VFATGFNKWYPDLPTVGGPTLADGQDAGEMLLNIEARIGELYESLPSKERAPAAERAGGGKIKDMEKVGIAERAAQKAQTIHRNPAAVAAIIKEAAGER